MSARVSTITGAPTESTGTGVRVAVMTVSSSSSCAKRVDDERAAATHKATREEMMFFMTAFPCTPAWIAW
jgi:hypothetical protein